jgi:alpha/beta superfamily hydrolase
MATEALRVVTADEVVLVGDLHLPPAGVAPVGGAVVCHPHPLYGGDRHNPVVVALARALADAGHVTARFDFRGAGGSGGSHGGGVPERADVAAVLDAVHARVPGGSLILAGYSFGAAVALSVLDPRITAWVAVALPLALLTGDAGAGLHDGRPVLVLSPEHDQFSPPDRVTRAAANAGWPAVTVLPVPMADHFLAGATATVADAVVAFVQNHSTPG